MTQVGWNRVVGLTGSFVLLFTFCAIVTLLIIPDGLAGGEFGTQAIGAVGVADLGAVVTDGAILGLTVLVAGGLVVGVVRKAGGLARLVTFGAAVGCAPLVGVGELLRLVTVVGTGALVTLAISVGASVAGALLLARKGRLQASIEKKTTSPSIINGAKWKCRIIFHTPESVGQTGGERGEAVGNLSTAISPEPTARIVVVPRARLPRARESARPLVRFSHRRDARRLVARVAALHCATARDSPRAASQ